LSKKFKVVTLGCRTNQYESQAYIDQLRAMGYREADEDETADLCIVNTCTVTESADSHSRHQIRSLARKNSGAKIVVTGCLAESLPKMEEVDLIVLNKDKESLLSLALPDEAEFPEFSIRQFDDHTRAFVKVQDGCNSFCTYCVIPYVRGRSRSRPLGDILREVRELISNGYKEVVLTGINIGDFDGGDGSVRLAALVRAVDKVEGLERLRISSIDPDEVDDDLLDAVLNGVHTCPSFHIVLQSGSNVILKRMNRKYTRQIFQETIEKVRSASPDFTFTTDVIVGFPGETDADFQDTLGLMQEVKFAKVHMFPYSDRQRTRAALFPNKVPHSVIAERKAIVLEQAEKCAFDLRERYIGRRMKVLLEREHEGMITGHTENFLSVSLASEGLQSNQIVTVLLSSNTPDGLRGRLDAG
jgi:threonylcarbamoyladenosine tRNA methylthiotransferase MtaB